jgi:hypothetical protein
MVVAITAVIGMAEDEMAVTETTEVMGSVISRMIELFEWLKYSVIVY